MHIKNSVNRIETAIKAAHPSVQVLFVKPRTQATWEKRIAGFTRDVPMPPRIK